MLGLTPGEVVVVGFVVIAVVTAGWWPSLGATIGGLIAEKRRDSSGSRQAPRD